MQPIGLNREFAFFNSMMERPKWVKKQKYSKNFEVINVKKHEGKDFRIDEGCYVLIRVYFDIHEIGDAICDYKHTSLKEFRGGMAHDLYTAIFDYGQ